MRDRLPWIGRILGALGVVAGVLFGLLQLLRLLADFSETWVLIPGISSIVLLALWIYLDWDGLIRVVSRRGMVGQLVSWLMVLLVAGILVLVNFMSSRHHWEKDITEGSVHSLAQQTQDALDSLEQPVSVVAFYAEWDPYSDGLLERDAIRRLLEKYRDHSDAFTFELIDPDIERRRAELRGATQNGTVFVIVGEREERLIKPDESALTNALIKLSRDTSRAVYFLTGHGEHEIQGMGADGLSELSGKLSQTGTVVDEIDLLRTGTIPEDADVLVIAGPIKPLQPGEVRLIAEFVEVRGGGLLLLQNPGTDSGLEGLLEEWGIRVGRDLVVDVDPLRLSMVGDYATIIADRGYHEITQDLGIPARLQGARTVSPVAGSAHARELLSSGKAAWAETDLEAVEVAYDPEVDELGPVAVAAVTEVARSAAPRAGDDDSADGEVAAHAPEAAHDHASDEELAPVVVFGDSDFASNAGFNQLGNADYALNSIAFLMHEEDLITIQARDEADRPLEMSGLAVALVFVIAVPGMTLVVFGAGIVAWIRRMAR